MNRPWIKFYPADWRADPRLRMCSLSARGLWIDLISYMHEGEPYGHLLIDGTQPDLPGIAALVGRPLHEVRKAISELEARGVFSRNEAGAIYSRRMTRDNEKQLADMKNGKGGGNPKLMDGVNGGVNPPDKPPDKAQKLEARNQKPERSSSLRSEEPRARARQSAFDQFWAAYPHKVGKRAARKAFDNIAKTRVVEFAAMMDALSVYTNKTDDRPWCNPATWLNEGRWDDQPASVSRSPRHKKGFADLALELDREIQNERNHENLGEPPFTLTEPR